MKQLSIPLVTAALLATVTFSNPALANANLHVMKTSITAAKQMAANDYSDGTNILVVNWSHQAVEVDVPGLDTDFILDPIDSGNNSRYIYSDTYYSDVMVDIYSEIDGSSIATVDANNPSTVEIRDPYAAAMTHALNITNKPGLN